jgi:hypothetical protein
VENSENTDENKTDSLADCSINEEDAGANCDDGVCTFVDTRRVSNCEDVLRVVVFNDDNSGIVIVKANVLSELLVRTLVVAGIVYVEAVAPRPVFVKI